MSEIQYCQSCGMPLRFDVEAYLGTNADHSPSNEYCYYCLKDGRYTVDIPMKEMVNIWVKFTGKYNEYSDTGYTPKELNTLLNKRLPTLKRWRQKEETKHIHYYAIDRIKTHIDQNLFRDIDSRQLAAMVNLSFFHFRRVFKDITGENIGVYIQRLRLEYIAHLLIATGQSIKEILSQTNYQTKSSLSKAFRMHFGVSMSSYRKKYQSTNHALIPGILPEVLVKRINTMQILSIEVNETFRNEYAYKTIWKQLIHYRDHHLQYGNCHFVSISQDNPIITPVKQCRFYIGIILNEYTKPQDKLSVREIPGGMYAVFRHKGDYTQLPELYKTIYEQWLPQSLYFQKYPLSFEIYLNTPQETSKDNLLTDIYIPINKQN
ncbi:MAG: GyrI-like domain-containing protein [Bacteroidales bacterium]|nr:GyrI-like domain-containing protein [Bacteroidales bacterium]